MIPPGNRAGALVQRLAALLCLVGACVFGGLAMLVSRLDRVPGTSEFRLPGGAALDPAALTVLTTCAGVLATGGLASLLLATARPNPGRAGPSRRPALVLLLGTAALVMALVIRRSGH